MAEVQISIGQIKRDISELVNRVAFAGERVILTSRGKPKAALISMQDYEKLLRDQAEEQKTQWQNWLAACDVLADDILTTRQGEPIDVDSVWEEIIEEREERLEQLLGR